MLRLKHLRDFFRSDSDTDRKTILRKSTDDIFNTRLKQKAPYRELVEHVGIYFCMVA